MTVQTTATLHTCRIEMRPEFTGSEPCRPLEPLLLGLGSLRPMQRQLPSLDAGQRPRNVTEFKANALRVKIEIGVWASSVRDLRFQATRTLQETPIHNNINETFVEKLKHCENQLLTSLSFHQTPRVDDVPIQWPWVS
jgi:hypothetical protein